MTLCHAEDYILYIFRYVSAFSGRDFLEAEQHIFLKNSLILTKYLFPFFRFCDEKLTRSNVRNIQDSNVNVDKVVLKYKAVWRENVARDSKLKGKHDALIV